MANFDLSYYSGVDDYSDGDDVENYIYEAAKAGKTLEDIPTDEMIWPVFYHLTSIRENICNWYPFKKDASVLEIGAGCGAVTGVLCRNAASVTSVELSKRRASINYERNKEYENLNIIVGNLNDVSLDEKFDYITLIGVLEYAGKFTEGEKPFESFLTNLKKYLKPGGAILIAIENRLGLKYFSGAPEDHTNRLFEGINNYPNYNGVKTFSKSELTDLLDSCGLKQKRFYYPYPDYKLPTEIFTDSSVNRNKRPYYTYDVDRYSLFFEADVHNVLQHENVEDVFANSFFVEAREDDVCDDSVLYVKQNQDRKEEFRVGTIIYGQDERYIRKIGLHPAADKHIQSIFENDNKEYGKVATIKGKISEGSIEYPYIENETLEHRLKGIALSGDKDAVISELNRFFEDIFSDAASLEFYSDEFRSVFGEEKLSADETECVCPANIDLAPSNVFCEDEGFVITDCEWVFDFAVPVAFVKWRLIRALYVNIPEISRSIPEDELCDAFGIDADSTEVFSRWEAYFIHEYAYGKGQGIPRKNEYKELIYGEEERLRQAVAERERVIVERDSIIAERNNVIAERDNMIAERDNMIAERDNIIVDRDNTIREYEEQAERYRQSIADYQAQLEGCRQSIADYQAQLEDYRQRLEETQTQSENYRQEMLSLKHNIDAAHQHISYLSGLRSFKSLHLYKRIKHQLILGGLEDKRSFIKWLQEHNSDQDNYDDTYNYLMQVDNLLLGTDIQSRDNWNAPESNPIIIKGPNAQTGVAPYTGEIKKVSAVIPNYNYERYLDERIDSILYQSYPVSEIIILDDCSSDGSEQLILRRIEENNTGIPIRYVPNEKNSGSVFAQWQKAFDQAGGDYVWIAEADDSCNERFLETVMQGFDDEEVVLSYCESLTMDENDALLMGDLRVWIDIFNCGRWNENYVRSGADEVAEVMCINNTIANVSSAVIKRDDYSKVLEDARSYKLAGDWYTYMNILKRGKIAYFKESLNYHRMQTQGVTLSTSGEEEFDEIVRLQDYALDNFDVSDEVKNKVYERREREKTRFGL